jgi:hypothetical protein
MNDQTGMHYRRFQYNAALASRMEQALPQHLDWCAVAAFYAAMHVLDAYLSTKQFAFPIDSHPNRNRAIRLSPELRRFGTSYRELQEVSEQVRYDPGSSIKSSIMDRQSLISQRWPLSWSRK